MLIHTHMHGRMSQLLILSEQQKLCKKKKKYTVVKVKVVKNSCK